MSACGPTPSAAPSAWPGPSQSGPAASAAPGRLFGRIASVDRAGPTLTVDLAAFLGGEEAIAAARADGVIGPTEDLPNDFYIDDLERRETYALDLAARVTVLGWDAEGGIVSREIGLEAFVNGLPDGPADGSWGTAGVYWFDVAGEVVVGIEAQYIP
jgi:hypothetical protein